MNIEIKLDGETKYFYKDYNFEVFSNENGVFIKLDNIHYHIKNADLQSIISQVSKADYCILDGCPDGYYTLVCRSFYNTEEKPTEGPEEKSQDKKGPKLYEFGTTDFFDRLDYELAVYRTYWTDTTKDVDKFYNERKDCNILCCEEADDDPYKKYRPVISFIQSLHTYDNEKLRINSKSAFDLIKKYIPSFNEVWPSQDMLGEYDILQIGGEEYDLFIMNETDENQPCILIKNRHRNVTYYINSISEETY